jgi:putative methyltransferase (TIGR04325 family)
MNNKIVRLTKAIIPSLVFDLYRTITGKTRFSGNFRSWEDASKASNGYDSKVILNKVRDSLMKVKNNEAAYERDSVLFDKVQYSWPLLAGLLWVASLEGNRLNLIDFGGSLGSSYYQNKKFLSHLNDLNWSIIEQDNFVVCGKRQFEDDHLKFYYSLDECFNDRRPNVILFSSVIQYLEKPYDILDEIVKRDLQYIIFDRTPMLESGNDRLTVQQVPPEIYPASYPAWFFDKAKFLSCFAGKYELMAEFDALAGSIDLGDVVAKDEGFIFRKKQ